METNDQTVKQIDNEEIDLASLMIQIWAGRKIILITIAFFIITAILYLIYISYSGIREYESQTTLFVESPSPDSLITVTKSPLYISQVLKIKLIGLKSGSALTVAEILDQQTKPPQGNLAGLTNRITATKGDAGVLVINVKMQDQSIAKQLADSVIQKLNQFLKEAQIKRASKNQEILAEDTSRKFQHLRETTSRNLQYLLKITSNNIQFLNEGFTKNIQYQNVGSAKNIQFLNEGYNKAKSDYIQSQNELADYYTQNKKNPDLIDSLEVKRINAEIKLKYNVYSNLYQQLESIKIDAKKQFEQVKIDAEKQLGMAKLDANKQLEQTKLNAEKELEQAIIDMKNQMEQDSLNAVKKYPVINVLEPATSAIPLNVLKTKKVLLWMVIFGIVVGTGIVFGKKFWEKNFMKKEQNNKVTE